MPHECLIDAFIILDRVLEKSHKTVLWRDELDKEKKSYDMK